MKRKREQNETLVSLPPRKKLKVKTKKSVKVKKIIDNVIKTIGRYKYNYRKLSNAGNYEEAMNTLSMCITYIEINKKYISEYAKQLMYCNILIGDAIMNLNRCRAYFLEQILFNYITALGHYNTALNLAKKKYKFILNLGYRRNFDIGCAYKSLMENNRKHSRDWLIEKKLCDKYFRYAIVDDLTKASPVFNLAIMWYICDNPKESCNLIEAFYNNNKNVGRVIFLEYAKAISLDKLIKNGGDIELIKSAYHCYYWFIEDYNNLTEEDRKLSNITKLYLIAAENRLEELIDLVEYV